MTALAMGDEGEYPGCRFMLGVVVFGCILVLAFILTNSRGP
jgi:hypothetical protein